MWDDKQGNSYYNEVMLHHELTCVVKPITQGSVIESECVWGPEPVRFAFAVDPGGTSVKVTVELRAAWGISHADI